MQINKNVLEEGKLYHYSEDIDFSREELNPIRVRKILNCHVEVDVTNIYYGHTRVVINLKSDVVLPCSYTLEDVDYCVKGQEEFIFVDEEEEADEDSGLIYEAKDIFDLNPYIFGVLIALIPLKVVKKGAKLPKGGKDYQVLSEDEYYEQKSKKQDPRWSKLDDIDFDDEE